MPRRESIDEKWVKKEVKKILKEFGVWYFMPVAGLYTMAGVPDFVCCVQGKFLGIETKANGKKPSDIQKAVHEKIRSHGGLVAVVDEHNLDGLKALLSVYAKAE